MIHSRSDLTRDPRLFADNPVGASETHLGAHASYKGRSALSEVRRLTRRLRLRNKRCLNKSGLARPNSNLRKGKAPASYIACIDSGRNAEDNPPPFLMILDSAVCVNREYISVMDPIPRASKLASGKGSVVFMQSRNSSPSVRFGRQNHRASVKPKTLPCVSTKNWWYY